MKSEIIKAGGYTLSYTYHKGKKPMTIVPIHGLGGSKDYWQPIHDYPELAAYSILVPVLAVYGEKNRGIWTSEKKLAALFPLVFTLAAGHMMMADNPDAFYGEVATFIKGLK